MAPLYDMDGERTDDGTKQQIISIFGQCVVIEWIACNFYAQNRPN